MATSSSWKCSTSLSSTARVISRRSPPDFGIVLLKIIEENGEELFGSIDDDDELDKVYDYYMQEVFADEDEDEAADAEE